MRNRQASFEVLVHDQAAGSVHRKGDPIMKPPRGLSEAEARAWARLAASVTPLEGRAAPALDEPSTPVPGSATAQSRLTAVPQAEPRKSKALPPAPPPIATRGLDASWDRKLSRAGAAPDFTLDLHGHTLDAAYNRLNRGLEQAIASGARLLLVVTGRPRPADAADRGERRGAIRAKLLDWLAAGPFADRVAAVRPAHPKHGGQGAIYIVLRRKR